ncbi:MAG: flagellar basal body P-ring formation chaperone FlgA [Candidatus Zixiibacteriota bacterium]
MTRIVVSTVFLFVVLVVATGALASADFDHALSTRIMETYQLDPTWYQVEVLSSGLKVQQLTEAQEITIRPLSQKEPLGVFTLIVMISEHGKEIATGQVSVNIHKFADVLVATDMVSRHETPGSDKLTVQRMEVTTCQEQPVMSLDATTGFRLKRNISRGQILTRSALEPIPDIEVGGEVTIVCKEGLLQVSVPGQTLEAGSAGNLVKVRNSASRKVITARVIDAKTVAVEP